MSRVGCIERESDPRQVIALISALYLSSPAIASEFCLDKGSAPAPAVCMCVSQVLSPRLATSSCSAQRRRGTDGIIIVEERDFCLAQRTESAPASAQTNTHKHSSPRWRCFLHAPDEKGRICTMVWFAAPFPESCVSRNKNILARALSVRNSLVRICFNDDELISLIVGNSSH